MITDYCILKNIVGFALSKTYQERKAFLLKLLRISRSPLIMRSPIQSLSFQIALLKNISIVEQTIQTLLKEHGVKKNDKYIVYNQRIRHILKDIADGLAWRLLGFNRPIMRILSQNRSSGFIKATVSKEDSAATKLIINGNHILIHDITNVLRIGDLTLIDTNGYPNIIEIKNKGKKIWDSNAYRYLLQGGGDLSKQAQKIVQFDEAVRTGLIDIGGEKAELGVISIPIKTYLNEVNFVLKGCQEKGLCGRFVDNILYIRALKADVRDDLSLPFSFNKSWLDFSSIETLYHNDGEFFRNKVPYSVWPFSDEVILQILSGEVIVESYINLKELRNRFERQGWKTKLIWRPKSIEEGRKLRYDNYNGPNLFNINVDTAMYLISKDGFNAEVNSEHLGMITMDFIQPEIILDTASLYKSMNESTRKGGYYGTGYLKERKIWR